MFTAVQQDLLWPNPEVVGVQSRLYSPGYVGPARWILFEPRARRSFSALGKDVVPDAISVLAAASGGASRAYLVESHAHLTSADIDRLIEAKLLTATPMDDAGSCPSFVSSFHIANIDYPFFDYGSPSIVAHESQLLDHYARLWPPPPAVLPRKGERYALPTVDVDPGCEPPEIGLTLRSLAWVLRTALGPIGEIRTRHVTCVRRTTPSGGARHPTELAVVLRRPLGEVPVGTYTYDIVSHSLVGEEADIHREYAQALAGHDFGFMVRTRVERPMWRYRDLRALRPVLIDAGHVAELVTFLLGRLKVSTEAVSAPVACLRSSWLDEPEVVLIRPQLASEANPHGQVATQAQRIPAPDDGEAYFTNPALVLRFDGGLHAIALWPSTQDLQIDSVDFLGLNHCLPSARGDRNSSVAGIIDAVPGASAATIERLREGDALLPRRDAKVLYGGSRLWIRHDWYMALLAYLEALSYGIRKPVTSRIGPDYGYVVDPGAVFRRRTTRVFSSASLSASITGELLRRVFLTGWHPDIDVSLAAWNVHGLSCGLYRWREGDLYRVGQAPTRDAVAANSAGQTSVSSGALTIWVSTITDVEQPARYLMDLVDSGRLGQRLCLAATDMGVAIFLTPAVHDRGTCSLLGIGDADRRLTYVFGLGIDTSSKT